LAERLALVVSGAATFAAACPLDSGKFKDLGKLKFSCLERLVAGAKLLGVPDR
jgi:hypothetical protein